MKRGRFEAEAEDEDRGLFDHKHGAAADYEDRDAKARRSDPSSLSASGMNQPADSEMDHSGECEYFEMSPKGKLNSVMQAGIAQRGMTVTLNGLMKKMLSGVDVTDMYSPERVITVAWEYGLAIGLAMDFTTGWDLASRAGQYKAWKHIRECRPLLIIGSPPCTMFSMIQNWNWGKSPEQDARMREKLR